MKLNLIDIDVIMNNNIFLNYVTKLYNLISNYK